MPSFLDFVGEEARSYTAAHVTLSDQMMFVSYIDQLFQELHNNTRKIDKDEANIVNLASHCQNRLYTAVLAYMRGQRSDCFSICRIAVEASMNAFLLHRGILTREVFEEGGKRIQVLYSEVNNKTHPKFVPEIAHLQISRNKLAKWGPHAELNSIVFRVTEGSKPGELNYNFFESSQDPIEYQYFFLCVLANFANILIVFADIAIEREKDWGSGFQAKVQALQGRIMATAKAIDTPEGFGQSVETPDE